MVGCYWAKTLFLLVKATIWLVKSSKCCLSEYWYHFRRHNSLPSNVKLTSSLFVDEVKQRLLLKGVRWETSRENWMPQAWVQISALFMGLMRPHLKLAIWMWPVLRANIRSSKSLKILTLLGFEPTALCFSAESRQPQWPNPHQVVQHRVVFFRTRVRK